MNQPATSIIDDQLYLPQLGTIVEIRELTEREKYFKLELQQPLNHSAGQFVMVSIPGIGESAISITCGPRADNILEMVIRRAGTVTQVVHALEVGEVVGIRGPYGRGFPMDEIRGKDLLLIAGGLGLVPMRSLLLPVVEQADEYGSLHLISGSRTPSEALFRDELKVFAKSGKINVIQTVDRDEHQPWKGRVGLVTEPISELELNAANTVVVMIGPPVMYKFVLMELELHHRIPHQQIFVDMERRMKCGVGKCGHCQINSLLCCQDGPVFRYSEIALLPEALG